MIAGLLLAAGGARRFGSQKLAALVGGEAIVRRAASALAGVTDELLVVVGSDAALVRHALGDCAARVILNENWAEGLSTSLRCGIAALDPATEAVVVALGDQPRVDPQVARSVIERWRAAGRPIAAPRYRGVQGHPVLFARSVFGELAALSGDRGAKAVIEREAERVAWVEVDAPMPRDVDTRRDLGALR